VTLVKTYVSEERIASFIMVEEIGSMILSALKMEVIPFSETSVLATDIHGVTSQKTAFYIMRNLLISTDHEISCKI
jgi:hypothetical protein